MKQLTFFFFFFCLSHLSLCTCTQPFLSHKKSDLILIIFSLGLLLTLYPTLFLSFFLSHYLFILLQHLLAFPLTIISTIDYLLLLSP
jgi:hypothetical protein